MFLVAYIWWSYSLRKCATLTQQLLAVRPALGEFVPGRLAHLQRSIIRRLPVHSGKTRRLRLQHISRTPRNTP